MDIVTFQTFLAAAATGSFSGAAGRINASPSSVTERIKQLEYRLGARLFERDKRGCTLTPAGQRFVEPARQAVRAWELARHEVGLPEHFEHSLSFGGQYFLWDRLLMDWLERVRISIPDLALRVTAGAWARLNRDLAEGALDMIVVHDPVFRSDIVARKLFEDELVLVTGGENPDWRSDFVRIDWGRSIGLEIAARLGVDPEAGLVLDLGERSARWLADNRMAGYMPRTLTARYVEAGTLTLIEDAPSFAFPAYLCWRRGTDADLAARIHATLDEMVTEKRQNVSKPSGA